MRNRSVKLVSVLFICSILPTIGSCYSSPEENANALYVSSMQLAESAESAATTLKGMPEALSKYTQVLSQIQKIISDYPSSSVAVKLMASGNARQAIQEKIAYLTQKIDATKRYQDNGDGTVTDAKTNLRWKRCAEGQTWAGNTCSGSATGYPRDQAQNLQKNGWRLPSVDELKGLVYCDNTGVFGNAFGRGTACPSGASSPTIVQEVFPNTPSSNFWSGSPDAGDSSGAWYVDFYDGDDDWNDRNDVNAVRLVRAGQ